MKIPLLNRFLFFILSFLIFSAESYARFGGGGARKSSGGGRSFGGGGIGGGGLHFFGFHFSWTTVIIIAVIIIAAIIYGYIAKQKKLAAARENLKENLQSDEVDAETEAIIFAGSSEPEFKQKVNIAFNELQASWQVKNTKGIRRFISDGMYRKVVSQFEMMDKLSMVNKAENLTLGGLSIVKTEKDGDFDVVHVKLDAYIEDKFESEKYPELNHGEEEDFTEYWIFYKKGGASSKDIYHSNNCPNCGDQLPTDMGDIARCRSCGSLSNSGEFDWVLTQVVQEDYYTGAGVDAVAFTDEQFKSIFYRSKENSIRYLEDIASNMFLQVKMAHANQDTKQIQRFCAPDFLKAFVQNTTQPYLFSRIYINSIQLLAMTPNANNNQTLATYSITWAYQRVRANGALEMIDGDVNESAETIVLSRNVNSFSGGYSMHKHQCPSCGAPIADTSSTNCSYCQSPILSTDGKDWQVIQIG